MSELAGDGMTKEPSEDALREALEIIRVNEHTRGDLQWRIALALDRHAAAERERLAQTFQDEGHRPIYTDGVAIAAAIRSAT